MAVQKGKPAALEEHGGLSEGVCFAGEHSENNAQPTETQRPAGALAAYTPPPVVGSRGKRGVLQ